MVGRKCSYVYLKDDIDMACYGPDAHGVRRFDEVEYGVTFSLF